MKVLSALLPASALLLSLAATPASAQPGSAPARAAASTTLSITRYVAPAFPEALRLAGVLEGSAVVVFSHDADGAVTDALALECSDPAFAREATLAVRQWLVSAHTHEGHACQAAHGLRFAFRAGGVVSLGAQPLRGTEMASPAPRTPRTASLVAEVSELDAAPRVLQQTPPAWSGPAEGARRAGAVEVTYFIDEEGRVRVPSVLAAPDAAAGEAVLRALAQWRYESPRQAGKPVAAVGQLRFELDSRSTPKTFAVTSGIAETSRR